MKEMMAQMEANPVMAGAPSNVAWALSYIAHTFGNDSVQKITDAISKVRTGDNPPSWMTIFMTIFGFVISSLMSGHLDLAAVIQAILNLMPQPTPTPAVVKGRNPDTYLGKRGTKSDD